MSWAIEEYVEDAIVAHLRQTAPGELRVFAAGTEDAITLPAVAVYCGDGANTSEDGPITGRRAFDVSVQLRCEAAPLMDDAGNVILSTRERFRALRESISAVIFDSALADALNALTPDRVLFSMAHPTATTGRTAEDRAFVASWTIEVIAQGVAE